MKAYESLETGRVFMPGLPIYARLDGRAFHTFTRSIGCAKPYDEEMSRAMIETARYLIEQTHANIAYTQSDEISLCWHSDDPKTQLPFGGKIFKLTSVLASLATASFMRHILPRMTHDLDCMGPEMTAPLPVFDARVFQFPDREECANAFLWRERDATKNAVSMAAHAYYSPKQLHGKTGNEKQELLFQKGVNFNDYPPFFKRGVFLRRVTALRDLTKEELARIPVQHRPTGPVERSSVVELDMPPFDKVTNRVGVIFRKEDPQ